MHKILSHISFPFLYLPSETFLNMYRFKVVAKSCNVYCDFIFLFLNRHLNIYKFKRCTRLSVLYRVKLHQSKDRINVFKVTIVCVWCISFAQTLPYFHCKFWLKIFIFFVFVFVFSSLQTLN